MPQLVALAEEEKLAAQNGYHSQTHGLPENFGGRINVIYSDGVKISVSDNQSPIIEPDTGRRIAELFKTAMQGEKVSLPDISGLREIRFSKEEKDGGFTRATLTLNADGTAVNAKKRKFEDPKVYESEKPVDAETVTKIKQTVENCFMFAWSSLPANLTGFGAEKSLTFVFADGKELTASGDRLMPESFHGGFFNIEMELSTLN